MAHFNAALRQRKGINWQKPHTIVELTPSSVFTLCICLLGLFALLLVVTGLTGMALGPLLLWMGVSLLKFVLGMLLLLFLFRLSMRLLQTLLRTVRKSQAITNFMLQIRPWLLLAMAFFWMAARAFWRWYQDQQRGA